MAALFLIITALMSYAFGGFNGAIIISKYIMKKDIRDYGSGNAGLTNFYRTFGAAGALMVLLVDVLKSIIPILVGGALMGSLGYEMVGKLYSGFCLMLGHSYPAMYGLRGGKGALCGAVLIIMADWRAGVICLLVFLIVVVFSRYVSLGSIAAAVVYPITLLIFQHGGLCAMLGLFCSLLLIFQHRGNIGRLLTGSESKLELRKTKPAY